ncbi:MAG: hypothetical protein AAFQ92_04165 [Bacteroidota bacterium]
MINALELSRLINNNGCNLLDVIDIGDIQSYSRLRGWLLTEDVSTHTSFQETFRDYYGLGGVGVNKEFIQKFFEVLESQKTGESFDFRVVSRELLGARPKRKLSSAQFAYLSKMANVINPDYPIYDNHIADIFEFEKPTQSKLDSRERMNVYVKFYEELRSIYQTLLSEAMIHDTLVVFKILLKKYRNEEFPNYSLPDMKKLDFLVEAVSKNRKSLVKAAR